MTTSSASRPAVTFVIAQGVTPTPRALIQALNLQQLELEVCKQIEVALDPDVADCLLILRERFPEIYRTITRFPEVFFYLHALLTGKPNLLCCAIELQEIQAMGLPTLPDSSGVWLNFRDPEVSRLFNAVPSLPNNLNADILAQHIAWSHAPIQAQDFTDTEDVLSGDPIQIRRARLALGVETLQRSRREVLNQLVGLLSMPEQGSEKIGRLLFALARLGEADWLAAIRPLIHKETPEPIWRRFIFAVGYCANEAPEAAQALIEIAWESDAPLPMRELAARALRPDATLPLTSPKRGLAVATQLSRYLPNQPQHHLERCQRDSLLAVMAEHPDLFYQGVQNRRIAPQEARAQWKVWADRAKNEPAFWERFVTEAQKTGPGADEAFKFLMAFSVADHAASVLPRLLQIGLANATRLPDVLSKAGPLQCEVAQWSLAWELFLEEDHRHPLTNHFQPFVEALATTVKPEAVKLLERLWDWNISAADLHRDMRNELVLAALSKLENAAVSGAQEARNKFEQADSP
jgi:hypothetical protein